MADRAAELIGRLRPLLGPGAILTDPGDRAARAGDATPTPGEVPLAVLRPATTDQVATILRHASALGQPVVVQGGRTGLSGGARVRAGEVALSLERLTGLSPPDAVSRRIVAGAGVALERVQSAARAAGLQFPVDLGARGSATIGGMIATNAGGIRVLRHGMMRAQVAGLEAVLPDGTVLRHMTGAIKDNAGPDLTRALIGSEGVLGVVTAASLRLIAAPATEAAALIAVGDLPGAIRLLTFLRGRIEDLIASYEIVFPDVYAGAAACAGTAPLPSGAGLYVLTDIQGQSLATDETRFRDALEEAAGNGLIDDAVISGNGREYNALWSLREAASAFIFSLDDVVGHDIGLPLDRMPEFMNAASAAIGAADPQARALVFGHLGDGNLHYIVETRHPDRITPLVMTAVANCGGTVSAEHGLGQDKAAYLPLTRSPGEIALLRLLKTTLDPADILNPGRVLPPDDCGG